MENSMYIYVLIDPKTDEVRYVGKASDPQVRYNIGHRGGGNLIGRKRVAWIRELGDDGLEPNLLVIDRCSEDEVDNRERYWMLHFIRLGSHLTNKHMVQGGRYTIKITDRQRKMIKKVAEDNGVSYTALAQWMIDYAITVNFEDIIDNKLNLLRPDS